MELAGTYELMDEAVNGSPARCPSAPRTGGSREDDNLPLRVVPKRTQRGCERLADPRDVRGHRPSRRDQGRLRAPLKNPLQSRACFGPYAAADLRSRIHQIP